MIDRRLLFRRRVDNLAFQGYLIKVGNYEVPQKYINAGSYNAFLSAQDLDSYRDGNGVLHRNALEHTPAKVEFETASMLTGKEFAELMKSISDNYISSTERKASITAYLPEQDDYIIQDMYMPDIIPTINSILNGEVRYNSIRIACIGY